ncbi:hypothetical protein G1C96_0792 [Bifidobacterium sp. DSM 109958]|uniref:Uncharacterized protein n=2 Tax=Bifidobacterium moraviense TaxID=2675323 RepID=A0A7Y0F1L5_9BIFI|nr:hypothetical protein [Bifidobacterium sp. DSM 109958]
MTSSWHRGTPGIDPDYLQRLSRKTRRSWRAGAAVLAAAAVLWAPLVATSRSMTDGWVSTLFTGIMTAALAACALWAWHRGRLDIDHAAIAKRSAPRVVSIRGDELARMLREAGVFDLLRQPDYMVRDWTSGIVNATATVFVTCVVWTPHPEPRQFTVYAHLTPRREQRDDWPSMRVVMELYGDMVRLTACPETVCAGIYGYRRAKPYKDPSLSYGSGIVAPRTDVDFGPESMGGSPVVA